MSAVNSQTVKIYPFFFQYEVRPTERNPERDIWAGAIATVVVFAATEAQARARAGRQVARSDWEIVEVKRVMLVQRRHLEHMDGALQSLYRKAEQAGVAAIFDGWKKPRR